MGVLDFLFPKKKPVVHALKWKIPESRITLPVPDAEAAVAGLRKAGARFVAGGTFSEVVHAKEFGEGVYGYFIVRTDTRTQKETLAFEGYMLQEDERVDVDVESAYQMMQALEGMGYREAFAREITVWSFAYKSVFANAFSVKGFGDFVEVTVPATKLPTARDASEKTALDLLKKLGGKEEDLVPTDVLTLQYLQSQQGTAAADGAGGGEKAGRTGAGSGAGSSGAERAEKESEKKGRGKSLF